MNSPTAIVKALLEMGMTQTAIAQETGISQPKLSRWAAGVVTSSARDAIVLQRFHESKLRARKRPAKAAS
jgi:predicted transcriptional regulator